MALLRGQTVIVDEVGDVIPNASVEVRSEATGALVPLYADRDGVTPIGNPITADAGGYVFFYVATGRYQIAATGGGVTSTWQDVILPEDQENLDERYKPAATPNRNFVANGAFRVNQMASASKTGAVGWCYDTWYYDGTYLYTFVEELDLESADYSVSWESDATCEYVLASTADGTHASAWESVANGGTITLGTISGNHLWVRFAAGLDGLEALDKVQVERGSVATDFDWNSVQQSLDATQRIYLETQVSAIGYSTGPSFPITSPVYFPVPMMKIPSISLSGGTATNVGSDTATNISQETFGYRATPSVSGMVGYAGRLVIADARPPVAAA